MFSTGRGNSCRSDNKFVVTKTLITIVLFFSAISNLAKEFLHSRSWKSTSPQQQSPLHLVAYIPGNVYSPRPILDSSHLCCVANLFSSFQRYRVQSPSCRGSSPTAERSLHPPIIALEDHSEYTNPRPTCFSTIIGCLDLRLPCLPSVITCTPTSLVFAPGFADVHDDSQQYAPHRNEYDNSSYT